MAGEASAGVEFTQKSALGIVVQRNRRLPAATDRKDVVQGHGHRQWKLVRVQDRISRRTFFRYFPAKEAVVFPENEDRLNAFITILEANSQPETPLNGLDVAVMTSAAVFSASKEVQLAQFKLIQASPTLTAYELQIDAGWEERIAGSWLSQLGPRHSAKKRLWVYGTAGSAMGMIRAVLRYWYTDECRGNLEIFAAEGLKRFRTGHDSLPR